MAQWATFAGVTAVVLALLIILSSLTQSALSEAADATGDAPERSPPPGDDGSATASPPSIDAGSATGGPSSGGHGGADPFTDSGIDDAGDGSGVDGSGVDGSADRPVLEAGEVPGEADSRGESVGTASSNERTDDRSPPGTADPRSPSGVAPLSSSELLANVALSQGLFAAVLIGAAVYTAIPPDALGIEFTWAYATTGLLLGTTLGIALYVANELGAASATRFGLEHDEGLRELLAPDTGRGWLVLLLVVVPIIAVFEEFLFRAALIGAMSAGFGISPWLLALFSSVVFAIGHGIQGTVGIVVTGVLGFVLAAAFVLTESLLVVVVAHYLIDAAEFVVHEGFGFEWAAVIEK